MILFNIIFAVIVDKFGSLRDNRAAVLIDLNNRCFICSIEREVFQKVISEKGFFFFFFFFGCVRVRIICGLFSVFCFT